MFDSHTRRRTGREAHGPTAFIRHAHAQHTGIQPHLVEFVVRRVQLLQLFPGACTRQGGGGVDKVPARARRCCGGEGSATFEVRLGERAVRLQTQL